MIQNFLFNFQERAAVAIYRLHGIDQYHQKIVHIPFILNDQIDIPVPELQSNTLPRIKWHMFIPIKTLVDCIQVFSQHPKTAGNPSENYSHYVGEAAARGRFYSGVLRAPTRLNAADDVGISLQDVLGVINRFVICYY